MHTEESFPTHIQSNVDCTSLFNNLSSDEQSLITNIESIFYQKIKNSCESLIIYNNNNNNTAKDILTVLFMGYKNVNFPLLLSFYDIYIRCCILHSAKHSPNTTLDVEQFLTNYCLNIHFAQLLKNNSKLRELLKNALLSTCHRFLPAISFQCRFYRIQDSIIDYSRYMFGMSHMIKNVFKWKLMKNKGFPFQMDFQIIAKNIVLVNIYFLINYLFSAVCLFLLD